MARGNNSTQDRNGNVQDWFARVFFETAEAYGTKLTEARVRVYASDLSDLEPQQVVEAFRRHRRDGKFFPSVAELRQQVVATPDDQALLAWTAMEQAASKVGSYQSVEFEDPIAAQALLQVFGSWPSWCEQETGPPLLVKRQQFLAAYRDIRRQQPDAIVSEPTRLSGLLEGGGNYQRRPELVMGRITATGAVLSLPEVRQAQVEGKTVRQLPPVTGKRSDDGEDRSR